MKSFTRFLVIPAILAIFSSALPAQETEEAYFSQAELDQMLAPIALYPDVLLSQVLMASTYPLEVVEASRWSQANPGLEGDEAVRAVEDMGWDPSVKTLVGFPDLIQLMDENLTWTRRLGDAFLIQEEQVMETIQILRSKALETGNLASLEHVTVEQTDEEIIIEPARVEVVYVPYYSTRIVYGDWWWPNYPPVYWYSRPAYYSSVGFSWSRGFRVSSFFYYTSCDWRRRNIIIHHHYHDHHRDRYDFRHVRDRRKFDERRARIWRHEPDHRKGVYYRSEDLNRKFDRKKYAFSNRDRPDRVAQWEDRYRRSEQRGKEERAQSTRSADRIVTRERPVRRDERVAREEPRRENRIQDSRRTVKPPPERQAPPPETVQVAPPSYSGQVDSSRSSSSDRRYSRQPSSDDKSHRGIRERSPKSRIDRSIN